MKYALYCVFTSPGEQGDALPSTARDRGVYLLENNGLCAAVAKVDPLKSSYELPEIISYHKVVESFFRRRTIIPFRFGAILDEEEEVLSLLEKNRARYTELLREIDGCAEFGIRIIDETGGQPHEKVTTPASAESQDSTSPGKAYLSRIRSQVQAESLLSEKHQATIEWCRTAFDGMYVKFAGEVSKGRGVGDESRGVLLSLYFLVRIDHMDPFQRAFSEIRAPGGHKIMLSGPWPPYNFVMPGTSSGKQSLPVFTDHA